MVHTRERFQVCLIIPRDLAAKYLTGLMLWSILQWKFCSREWITPMKWLVPTEELCSRSVPLEQNPGAAPLPRSSFQLAPYITPAPVRQLTFVGALHGSLVFVTGHFTIMCLVIRPMIASDAGCDLALIQTMQTIVVNIRTTWFARQKQWGLYQNKVTSSLAAIQRPGHWADNGKMVYYCRYVLFYGKHVKEKNTLISNRKWRMRKWISHIVLISKAIPLKLRGIRALRVYNFLENEPLGCPRER